MEDNGSERNFKESPRAPKPSETNTKNSLMRKSTVGQTDIDRMSVELKCLPLPLPPPRPLEVTTFVPAACCNEVRCFSLVQLASCAHLRSTT